MLIVVVGPNRAGKTTLIQKLRPILEMVTGEEHRLYKGLAPTDLEAGMRETWKVLRWAMNQNIIADRLPYPDDIVYRPIIEKQSVAILEEEGDVYNPFFKLVDTRIIYLTASLDVIKERYDDLGDHYHAKNIFIEEVAKRYEHVWLYKREYFRGLPAVKIDATRMSKDQVLEAALTFLGHDIDIEEATEELPL